MLRFLVAIVLFALAVSAFADPETGLFNVYAPVDEAAGYVGCADDLSEAAAAGFSLVCHVVPDLARYTGLKDWMAAHPNDLAAFGTAKGVIAGDEALAFQLFFWKQYLLEVKRQGDGKLKTLIGPLYPGLVDAKTGLRKTEAEHFIADLAQFEKTQAPDTIAGWFLTEEPLEDAHKHDPAQAKPLVDAIRAGETTASVPPHRIWIAESVSHPVGELSAFLAVADVLLISRDACLWNLDPPKRVDDAQYESIPHAVRLARENAHAAKNDKLKVQVMLQAFDWADDDIIQPSHLEMHQQVRYALSSGLADLGAYAGKGAWVEPADGVWLFWWSDCKGERKGAKPYKLNRWDDPAGAEWKEAWMTERGMEAGAIHITRDEKWFGSLTLIGDVIVHKGATLTIQPGTIVRIAPLDHFQGGKDKKHIEFIVQGHLVVEGNEQMKVVFRCDSESPKLNAKPRKPNKGDWAGFEVDKGGKLDKNKFTYVSDATKD